MNNKIMDIDSRDDRFEDILFSKEDSKMTFSNVCPTYYEFAKMLNTSRAIAIRAINKIRSHEDTKDTKYYFALKQIYGFDKMLCAFATDCYKYCGYIPSDISVVARFCRLNNIDRMKFHHRLKSYNKKQSMLTGTEVKYTKYDIDLFFFNNGYDEGLLKFGYLFRVALKENK